jgi:hypothetical protein
MARRISSAPRRELRHAAQHPGNASFHWKVQPKQKARSLDRALIVSME